MAFINQGRHIGTVGLVDPETFGGLITYPNWGNYKIHTFLTSSEFSLVGGISINIDIFSVGGGGSGGGPGGGGGGGIITHSNFSLSSGAWNIIVGAGGPLGQNAGLATDTNITGASIAGGGDAGTIFNNAGPSTGRSGSPQSNASGSPTWSGSAQAGGGGGGAGGVGGNAGAFGGSPGGGGSTGGRGGNAGVGLSNTLRTNAAVWYAGGGTGGADAVSGSGGIGTTTPGGGQDGPNTGGGGDGSGQSVITQGQSGIVVIRTPWPIT
jgi:hypothetical protein